MAHERAEKARKNNDGSAVDPRSAGRLAYDEAQRKEALKAATAEDELVQTFKQYNPYYASHGKAAKTVMG